MLTQAFLPALGVVAMNIKAPCTPNAGSSWLRGGAQAVGRRETVSRQLTHRCQKPGAPPRAGGRGCRAPTPRPWIWSCELALRGSHIDPKTFASFKE